VAIDSQYQRHHKADSMTKERYRPGSLERIKTAEGLCWYVRIQATVDGKKTRIRHRVGLERDFPNKSAVWRAAQGIVDDFNRVPDITRAEKRRFSDVIQRYKDEEMPKRHSTARGYQKILRNHIVPKWGNTFLCDLKPLEVRAWLKSLEYSSRYKGHIHGMMRVLFRFAMLWEWVPVGENPMGLFSLEGSSKRSKEPSVLSREQFGAVLAEIKEPIYRTMFLLAACLGLRCSELFALKWSDVLPDLLKVERAIVDGHEGEVKTFHSKKALPLHANVAAMLSEWRQKTEFASAEDWVFASWHLGGTMPPRPNNVQRRILIPAGKRAGLSFSLGWHTLRHTYKTWLDELEIPLTVQRDLMRHADIRTTAQVYGSLGMKTLRAANDRVIEMPMAENRKARA
jgi:integrase